MTQPDSPEGTGLTRRELRELRAREWAEAVAAASEEHPFVTGGAAPAPEAAPETRTDPFVSDRATRSDEPFIGVRQQRPAESNRGGRTSEPARSGRTAEPDRGQRTAEPAQTVTTSIGSFAPADEHSSGELRTLLTTGSHAIGPKKRRGGAIVIILIILALIAGLAFGGYALVRSIGGPVADFFGWNAEPTDYESGLATGEATIMIEKGDTGWEVSQKLHEAGVTLTEGVFYNMLVDMQQNPNFVPGAYSLQQKMTAAAALAALQDPESKLPGIVYPEGYTVEQVVPIIATALEISEDDVRAALENPGDYGVDADTLEGWLFPTSYDFTPGTEITEVVQGMVDRTRESLERAGVPAGDEERVLTIASIIQREAPAGEFGKVSAVIENRLDIDMKLQMDSTAQYGYGEMHSGSVFTSAEALADDNAWNTYVHTGLPAGPISNPGDEAIQAAMHPEEGAWLYFVAVNLETGETKFSETYEEQQQNEAELHAWCDEHPENAGCS
ncbi:hypothetical protein GCM10010910_04940 [Microbacterium nanhaiense]|uniref:Endolytic murein transglycosylase n=1 Tax=Microbacterium nanhaiense TaxID=1301026 RepID=A0ABQ2MYJ4_9MICO|nr:endolytic transglycosylase MltG [Microbacterium nanhaiense]GGO60178.1 hypothetical protein GCM10010910_04940 [Microbacterium nanhaiense]